MNISQNTLERDFILIGSVEGQGVQYWMYLEVRTGRGLICCDLGTQERCRVVLEILFSHRSRSFNVRYLGAENSFLAEQLWRAMRSRSECLQIPGYVQHFSMDLPKPFTPAVTLAQLNAFRKERLS
ncbi:hypothetical protein [Neptuniibacter sp. QD37_11]|uniref:hypothetical protein n=1 Tax=Neptuniibacter sp. QD37_11 TaxID=3398209 RepID=UPI0039F48D80